MAFGDQFLDTPENRESMKSWADGAAQMKGVIYVVVRSKKSGKLASTPKSMFDPETEEIIYEVSGGGEKAADERWEEVFRRFEEIEEQEGGDDEDDDDHLGGDV